MATSSRRSFRLPKSSLLLFDTHAWIWWAEGEGRLSPHARRAVATAPEIGISVYSCLEVAVLAKLGRVDLQGGTLDWIRQATQAAKIAILPMTAEIAVRAASLGKDFPRDPADRVIAATAIETHSALVTRDEAIWDSGLVEVVW